MLRGAVPGGVIDPGLQPTVQEAGDNEHQFLKGIAKKFRKEEKALRRLGVELWLVSCPVTLPAQWEGWHQHG